MVLATPHVSALTNDDVGSERAIPAGLAFDDVLNNKALPVRAPRIKWDLDEMIDLCVALFSK